MVCTTMSKDMKIGNASCSENKAHHGRCYCCLAKKEDVTLSYDIGTVIGKDHSMANSSDGVDGLLDRTRRVCGTREATRERDRAHMELADDWLKCNKIRQ